MTTRVVATAGHVDHGKSTLVNALTGTDPDRFAEEKRRGLTIDLGFARFTTSSGIDVDLIDVPGHVRFIKNMLAGVGAVDACLFVVSAMEGWKPQSEEHLRILELLGVRDGVVALTMAGLVDDDHLELARMDVEEHTRGTFLEGARVVAVDVPEGIGLAELRRAIEDCVVSAPNRPPGRTRLWVDRSFAIAGAGTVVTGTLTGGGLSIGEQVEVVSGDARTARVRGLQAFGEPHEVLDPGCRAAVNLAGLSHHAVQRGDALVRPGEWHQTRIVDASLHVLPSFPRRVRSGGAHLLYLGCGEHAARLRVLPGGVIAPGDLGLVRLTLPRALPLLPGDRFILRDSGSSTTVGGGELLDIEPTLPPARATPTRSVDRIIRERGWIEAEHLERIIGERREPTVGTWVVAPDALAAAQRALHQRVSDAGARGLDVAALSPRERALLDLEADLRVVAGRARLATDDDPYASHPFLSQLRNAPHNPPSPEEAGVGPDVVRELVRRGLAVAEGGIVFSAEAVDAAESVAQTLLRAAPAGVTVADFRVALGTTRRFAMPLLLLLDRRGVTRRRGDVRLAGPRLERTGQVAPSEEETSRRSG